MTIVNPTGVVKKYIDEKVSAEETARKNADFSMQAAVQGKVPTSRKVNGHALTADVTVTKSDVGLGNTDDGAKAPSTDATLASTTSPPTAKVVKDYVDGKFDGDLGSAAYKDVGTAAGNVPVLDSGGKLAASTIPALAISDYAGNFTSKTVLPTSGYQVGDWATVSAGQIQGENGAYMLTATSPSFVWTQIAKTPTEHTFGTLGGSPSDNTLLQAELDKKQNTITAGRGLEFLEDHKTLRITSTVGSGTIGSETVIPKLTYDDTGRITKAESVTVYPPTTAGANGQLWQSDGSGEGKWVTPLTTSGKAWESYRSDPVTASCVSKAVLNNQIGYLRVSASISATSEGTISKNVNFCAWDSHFGEIFKNGFIAGNETEPFEMVAEVHGVSDDDEYNIIKSRFKVLDFEVNLASQTSRVSYSSSAAISTLSFIIMCYAIPESSGVSIL